MKWVTLFPLISISPLILIYFDFTHIDDKKILKGSNAKKVKQENDIPIKLIKENIELFSSGLSITLNFYTDKTYFPNSLK